MDFSCRLCGEADWSGEVELQAADRAGCTTVAACTKCLLVVSGGHTGNCLACGGAVGDWWGAIRLPNGGDDNALCADCFPAPFDPKSSLLPASGTRYVDVE